MKVESVGQSFAKGATGVRMWARSVVNRARIASLDRADARERQAAKSLAPSIQERHDDLLRFYDRYESLVETLCDAAQIGPKAKFESDYTELRKWMYANYPGVRRFVVSYLRMTPEDARGMMAETGSDAFETLFVYETLEEFLKNDDGTMIDRITRTREALSLYGEHLRQLLARGA